MNVVAAVKAHQQPAEVVQPGEGALDDPTPSAKTRAVVGLASSDDRRDPVVADLPAIAIVVVAAIGK